MNPKEDYLESDPAIRGQNYVCLSFISPEKILENKNLFLMKNYLKSLINEKKIDLDDKYLNSIEESYQDFLYNNTERLEKEFDERNEFKTSVRGVKVRGVYDTLGEAQAKAKKLQSSDKNFNVFVGQVGYWLPWDPHPHSIEDQQYFESDLNTLVQKYKENQESKDQHFRENIDYVKELASNKNLNSTVNNISESDPWIKNNLEK